MELNQWGFMRYHMGTRPFIKNHIVHIKEGYKVMLICDKDKVEKRLIKNLEKMDVIVWDINKIVETQKKLYSLQKNIKE